MVHSSSTDNLLSQFSAWLEIENLRDGRHFLEGCPELLEPENALTLDTFLVELREHKNEIQQKLNVPLEQIEQMEQNISEHLEILRDIRTDGEKDQEVSAAYVNRYGGLVLDLPSWLDLVVDQLAEWYGGEPSDQRVTERAALLREAIEHAQSDINVPQEAMAELYYELGRTHEEDAWRYDAAITAYRTALQIYTLARYPLQYAKLQTQLASSYTNWLMGEESSNQEEAIACYQQALGVYTHEAYPIDYATTLGSLGNVYQRRIKGERRVNQEQAIVYYETALQIFTFETFPNEWGGLQNNLGGIYRLRIEGDRHTNLRNAVAYFEAALQVYAPDTSPVDYAMVQANLGKAYRNLSTDQWEVTVGHAIACYEFALQVYTRATFPQEWADIQHDLGLIYAQRTDGERSSYQEQAIAYLTAALLVYTRGSYPIEYALTQHNLGAVYSERMKGKRLRNIERAIACYEAALQVRTLEAFPADYRLTLMNLAEAEAARQNWAKAHLAYSRVNNAENFLTELGGDIIGHDAILKQRHNAATYNGFTLARLGRIEAAILAIEQGRARSLAGALASDRADPQQISDAQRRTRYQIARQALIAAQSLLNTPLLPRLSERERRRIFLERTVAVHAAKTVFDEVIVEVRHAQDPASFLQDTLEIGTILHAARCGGSGHTLVYLAATPWGGIAIAAFSTNIHPYIPAHFSMLDLPELTSDLVRSLIEMQLSGSDGVTRFVGGFGHAQEGAGFNWVLHDWEGKTLRERAEALHQACVASHRRGMLDETIQEALTLPTFAFLADQLLDTISAADQAVLANTLEYHFLQKEVQRCLESFASTALRPLVTWLVEQGARSLTLIPCGELAAFPLTAVSLDDGRTVSETLPSSVAPNARSLLPSEASEVNRSGVYAIGDPRPTWQELPWSEAEAHTLAKLARRLELPGRARVQRAATREWLISSLQAGSIVDVSCHGSFNPDNFLQSALLLAKGQRLYLGTLLSHEVDLRGLRLLILSACQTAVLDLRGARDEVRSLAAGILQAGARAVLASLWKVDDKAAYLLVVRFSQEWFPNRNDESPAAALARAQYWLRTVTNRKLRQWHATNFPSPTLEKQRDSETEKTIRCIGEGTNEQARTEQLLVMRGSRYEASKAEVLVHTVAQQSSDPEACPYAHPIYWAGFQIIGW